MSQAEEASTELDLPDESPQIEAVIKFLTGSDNHSYWLIPMPQSVLDQNGITLESNEHPLFLHIVPATEDAGPRISAIHIEDVRKDNHLQQVKRQSAASRKLSELEDKSLLVRQVIDALEPHVLLSIYSKATRTTSIETNITANELGDSQAQLLSYLLNTREQINTINFGKRTILVDFSILQDSASITIVDGDVCAPGSIDDLTEAIKALPIDSDLYTLIQSKTES